MSGFVDTHCHLQDPRFDPESTDAAIGRAAAANVQMVLCGYDVPTNQRALAIARDNDSVYPAVGFHPHEARSVSADMLSELESLAALPDVVAVGEVGLDFYRDLSPHDVQVEVLQAQLDIAARLSKPVSVHTRGAEDAALDPLAAYSRARRWRPGDTPIGVMHCFGGTLTQARLYLEVGFVISIACTITYPRNEELRLIASTLPLDTLVIETDSPYLPPQHMRGQRNEPVHVRSAAEAIAAARGATVEEVADATSATARAVFGLRIPAVSRC